MDHYHAGTNGQRAAFYGLRLWRTRGAAFLIVLLLASPALAQSPAELKAAKEQERTLFEKATAEYRLGYFDKAAGLYEEAYRVFPDPALLYNIGQSARKAGQREKALLAYQSYLRTATPDLPNIDLAKKHIEDLRASYTPGHKGSDDDAAMAPQISLEGIARLPALGAKPGGVDLTATAAPVDSARPHRWWLWSAAGVVIVGGLVTTLLLASRTHDPRNGSAGTAVVP